MLEFVAGNEDVSRRLRELAFLQERYRLDGGGWAARSFQRMVEASDEELDEFDGWLLTRADSPTGGTLRFFGQQQPIPAAVGFLSLMRSWPSVLFE